jgi:hypothetical protein
MFIAIFTLDGATRPGYLPARHPVSSLALGRRGWLQTANFAVTGILYLAGAAGLSRTRHPSMSGLAGPVLIGASAAGITAAAVFTTDPISGYPPGTPDTPTERSTAGTVHDLVSIPTFLGLPMAATAYSLRFARSGQPGWAAYSASTGIGMLAAFALSAAGFNQSRRLVDTAGLWQRVCIATGFTWLTTLMGRELHGLSTAKLWALINVPRHCARRRRPSRRTCSGRCSDC